MSQIGSFRKGWESENLARYFLSRFSFIANPSTISDDIGSDYYCTLFTKNKKGKVDYLIPKSFFGVQIKSNFEDIPFTNKIDYLSGLQFPYFVAVVDRDNLIFHIFSGEYIPILFSHRTPKKLTIKLCTREEDNKEYYEIKNRDIILNFPKIFEIEINTSVDDLNSFVTKFKTICDQIQKNISSRANKEYIFNDYNINRIYLLAGKDSAKTFRENIYKRLAEVFINISWIFKNDRRNFRLEEFQIYENLLNNLIAENLNIPHYVIDYYNIAKNLIYQKKQ